VLVGEPSACRDAAAVVTAMFEPGTHTVAAGTEHVTDAPNLPGPSVEGGPPVRWIDGDALRAPAEAQRRGSGAVVRAVASAPLPEPAPGTLVVLEAPLGEPAALLEALRRAQSQR
jgi:hypothetical protein